MKKMTIPIRGMHCKSCEILIEDKLKIISGVTVVEVSYKTGLARVGYRGSPPREADVREAIASAGYEIGQKDKLPWLSRDLGDYFNLILAGSILFALYLIASVTGLFGISVNPAGGGFGIAVLVGLAAGFSTCMALVGGLVLGLAARHAELHPEATRGQKFLPHLSFNSGRIIGFAVLGGVIGVLGSVLQPSVFTLGLLTLLVGAVMIFLGLKLVEIFPALKDKTLTLPKSIGRLLGVAKENKSYNHRSAFTAGALTFFLPCGFTQAMQLYAISTGSFWQGMLVMGLFAVGTAPGLLGIGGLSSIFRGRAARTFFATAGLAVILLGFWNISNASQIVFAPVGAAAPRVAITVPNGSIEASGSVQEIQMTQDASGYHPNQFTVERGRPVRWIINSVNQYTCAAYIRMPSAGINQPLRPGENIFEFTPTVIGAMPFSCSMGMFRGQFNVITGGAGDAVPAPGVGVNNAALAAVPPPANPASGSAGLTASGSCGQGGCGCGGRGRAFQPQAGVADNQPGGGGANTTQVLRAAYSYSQDILPNSFTVKANTPVRLEIDARDQGSGCMSTVMIPGLYDQPQFLEKGKLAVLEFTPIRAGDYPITCAMGVRRGSIRVE
ncbi:MAG: sulfite exporter TauE/SafE family protein [Candidatus Liptonbacteria bacterium]|nr:sulfite exporter TauE/SafE family protein [Candidatus Liptonbacteria bacterium]